jgi:hypothetical protein
VKRKLRAILLLAGVYCAPMASAQRLLDPPFTVGVDVRATSAVAEALALAAGGAAEDVALAPILKLPISGCAVPPKALGLPCEQEYGAYFTRPDLRAAALSDLVSRHFDSEKPSAVSRPLLLAALTSLVAFRGYERVTVGAYTSLQDRAGAERALAKSRYPRDLQRLQIGLLFDDLDTATEGAIGMVRIRSSNRPASMYLDELLEKVRAAGRVDLEIRILHVQLREREDANVALSAADRLVELGKRDDVLKELGQVARWSDQLGAQGNAWIGTIAYLRLGERALAEKVAAPWLKPDRDWLCAPGSPKLAGFAGHDPACNLGFHLREALAGERHVAD